MVRHECFRRHRGVPAGFLRQPQFVDIYCAALYFGIRTRRGEQCHRMAFAGESSCEMPDVGFQATGERLGDGEPAGCDQRDS